jgi:hypothetical protein
MRSILEVLHLKKTSPIIQPVRNVSPNNSISMTDYNSFFEVHNVERPLTDLSTYSQPKTSFSKLVEIYETVVDVSFGIDFLTEAIVGPGFYFSAANENLRDYLSDYGEEFKLDAFNTIVAHEKLAYGNSVFQKQGADLKWMPISSLKKIYWDGNQPMGYEFLGREYLTLPTSEIVHFTFRRSNASPFGLGLLHQLAVERDYSVTVDGDKKTRTLPSIVDIDAQALDDLRKILHRYIGRTIYKFPGASKANIDSNKATLKTLEPEEDFVVNQGEAQELGTTARRYDVDAYMEVVGSLIIKGIQNPVGRLFATPGFTYASVDAILEAAERKIIMFQRDLKRDIENHILKDWYTLNPWINANGVPIPWREAHIRLNWGVPDLPEIDPAIVLQAVEKQIMRLDEARENLKNMGYKVWDQGQEPSTLEVFKARTAVKKSRWESMSEKLFQELHR